MASTNSTSHKPTTAVARLRELLADTSKIIIAPGVYDGLTARIALAEKFSCLYMTGAGTTMSRLGMADLGVATFNDMRDNAGMIAGLDRTVPLIADADTGYGGPLMVGRTVTAYIQQGVAALHLEDQVQTKRCGHLIGKEIVDEDIFISRIRAAVMAREQAFGDIVIIARTDALQTYGYINAVGRLKKAIASGADVAFLEGPTSKEQCKQVCEDLSPTPVLLNMVAGGVTPDLSPEEASVLGFRVVIFPALALGPVHEAVSKSTKQLKSEGTVQPGKLGVRELFDACGLKEAMAFDMAAGGKSFSNGV